MTDIHQEDGPSPEVAPGVALDSETALATLRAAEADQQTGNVAAARIACETLIAAGLFNEWAHFLIGRMDRDEGNPEAAIVAFGHAIEADPTMFWAHCERLILAVGTAEAGDRQGERVEAFVAIPWEPLEGGNLRKVELLAHALWDRGQTADAQRIFAKLWPSPDLDRLTLVRIVEADSDPDLVAGGVARLEDLPDLDETARRILLQHYDRRGDVDKQLALLDGEPGSSTDSLPVWAGVARSSAKSPDAAALIARLQDFVITFDAEDASLSHEDAAHLESIAHVLWDAGDRDTAHRLFARIWTSSDIGVVTLLRIVEADRDAAMVGGAIERLEATPDLDETALRILVQQYETSGDIDRQLALLEARSLSPALALQAWTGVARAYARRRKERSAAGDTDRSAEDAALIARLSEFAEIVQAGGEPLPTEHVPQLESIAHVLWDAGDRDTAHRLFARIWTSSDIGVVTLLRIVEADRDAAMVGGAIERLEATPDLDETALRILVQQYETSGDIDRQLALLEARSLSPALALQAWTGIARAYARRRKERSAAGDTDRSAEDAALIARLSEFAEIVQAGGEPLPTEQVPQLESIAHVLWDAGNHDAAHRLFERIWTSSDIGVVTLLRIVDADRDAAMVGEALERLEAMPDLDETALRILQQHYERNGDTAKELALLDSGAGSSALKLRTGAALARSYAARRNDQASSDGTRSAEDAALLARLQDVAAAAEVGGNPLSAEDAAHLETIAHVLWDAGDRDAAHRLFARIWTSSDIGVVTLLRIVEADRDAAMVGGAIERLDAMPDLDETALRILVQQYETSGDIDRQLALLEARSLPPALALQAWTGIARAYARRRKERSAAGDTDRSAEDAVLIARLSEFAEIVQASGEPLPTEQVPQLESIAHVLWDDGYSERASHLFARMWPSANLGVITLVRIVDADREADMVAEAVERLESMSDLDETALRILLQHYERHGDNDRQLALLDGGALSATLAIRAWGALARSSARRRKGRRSKEPSSQDEALIARLKDFAETASDDPVPPDQVPHIESVAHLLWDADSTDEAYLLLKRMWPSADLGVMSLVRIVEADLDAAMVTEAIARLEASPGLDETALRVVGDHHARQGNVGREIALLERRRTAAPKDFQTWVALARSYGKKGDRDRAMAALEQGSAFPVRQRIFARLIVQVELGNPNAALIDFRTLARLYDEVPKFPGIRLAYMFGDAFDVPRRNEVLGLLNAYFAGDRDVALVKVNAAMRDQRWMEARQLFDAHFSGDEPQPQNVRLAHIDILAFSGDLQAAHALLEQERVDGIFPQTFLRSTLRILGELERWDEAFAIGLEHLSQDSSFEHFLSIIIRAGRKTRRSEEFFDALLALPRPLNPAQNDALFAVMEDLAETGHHSILDRVGEIEVPYERAHRIQLKLRGTGAPEVQLKDLCIYYCADDNYLMPALVSLTSLAMSNVSVARRAVFNLVVDSEVVPRATEAGGAIARRLGLTLKIVDAATIVSSADRLRTAYGLFTGGQQLALAAYYRIFFARHLAEHREFSQALYVDADTIVRSGLEELFAVDHAAPIMARYETDRPEVRHATEVHQLKGRYFNSGVLHFNLVHPDLPALLDRAIAAAIDPDVTLIFQDQCALNIAFDTQMSELPPRFNYFNPPSVSGDGIAATDAVIVHFLDRPKPWDSLYRRRAREWFEWFDLVETLRQGDVVGKS